MAKLKLNPILIPMQFIFIDIVMIPFAIFANYVPHKPLHF